jgi:hypothetical protein
MNNIIGFRQYLNSPGSFSDLKKIILGQQESFNPKESFTTIVALCGKDPAGFLREQNLLDKAVLYSFAAWEEKAAKVAQVYKKSKNNLDKVQIVHYSEMPLGLTYPLELLVQIANIMEFKHLAVSDSDFQMSYSEIRRAYDFHLSVCKNEQDAVITYPRRNRRSLDADKYPISRWAMEDLENLYIYMLTDLNATAQKADFQSGLSITNSAAHKGLRFDNVGSWIGNLHLAIQVIHNKGRLENNFVVETNIQNESTINFDVQCEKIDQLYKYYLIPLSNICLLAADHQERYLMNDWIEGKSKKEIKKTINNILEMYINYSKREKKN